MKFRLHPVTRKRLREFRRFRRAWVSFWILAVLYILSAAAELLSNSRPYWAKINGRTFFPIFRHYSEDQLIGSGIQTRPDYHAIAASHPDARMVFPPLAHGPLDISKPESIPLPRQVTVVFRRLPAVASVDFRPDGTIAKALGSGAFSNLLGAVTNRLAGALARRFANAAAPSVEQAWTTPNGVAVSASLPPYEPRAQPPRTVRVMMREKVEDSTARRVVFDPELTSGLEYWMTVPADIREGIAEKVKARLDTYVDPITVELADGAYRVSFEREDVRFPFRPVAGHPLGLDSAGRDVLARIIYGFRTSINFGLLLVVAAMGIGTIIGGAQGYFGGRIDLFGQRFTEIWENLPFLYVIMLLGSVFGRSFLLLLACYGLFNWIGISYYMRAEFLKLRRQPFVEGAICLGLPSRVVMFRHILPNALVPIITFAPFSLIGAVSSLAALDFLGFGLPPPMPSWGEMIGQAQEFKWAWWLAVYPGLALMLVILLCVFIGEGVRAAFDPRRFSHLE